MFLGRIPIAMDIRIFSDRGKSIIAENTKSAASIALLEITSRINTTLNMN
jgi:hypothetical protein